VKIKDEEEQLNIVKKIAKKHCSSFTLLVYLQKNME